MSEIVKVHLVFKTHLDLGYTARAAEVASGYFEGFIPGAIELASEMRRLDGPERFVWTTGSWLIHEYLRRATSSERTRMEQAIAAGDIAWHALPFTTHSELADASLFGHGLSLSRELDRRYGRTTIAAKLTDVPGHTRGIVPILAAADVRMLHVGVNPASTPPAVPPVFVWRAADGSDVIVVYATGDYGGVTIVPGCRDALIVEHTGDNQGPPAVDDVLAAFRSARDRFPGAEVVASTLDAFAHALAPSRAQLPIVTAEIGDSWIHGVGSDPLTVARFRELSRLRRHWLEVGAIDETSDGFRQFSTQLLLVAEHTWGLAQSRFLRDYDTYDAESFRTARTTPAYQRIEQSWRDHRVYVDAAIAELPAVQRDEAEQRLHTTTPVRPHRYAESGATIQNESVRVTVDNATGGICELIDLIHGRAWATPARPLAMLSYQTFSAEDYERFWREYIRSRPWSDGWAREDFTKPGIERADAISRTWRPTVRHISRDAESSRILIESQFPPECAARFGAPQLVTTEIAVNRGTVEITTQWFDKPACRLPEAVWMAFVPHTEGEPSWTLDKLDLSLTPTDVVTGGNSKLHAVGLGATCVAAGQRLQLETLDAPLIAPGKPALLRFGGAPPDASDGVHVNLYNNTWGNNFPTWYDDDARFRFRIMI